MTSKGQKSAAIHSDPVWIPTLGGSLSAAPHPTPDAETWQVLTNEQVRTLRIVCDRIIPEDDFPSASQAGVLAYMDRQLAQRYRQHRDAYRQGLEAIEQLSRQRFQQDICWLDRQQQIAVLAEFEQLHPELYRLFQSHTVEGYYGPQRAMKGSSFAAPRSASAGIPERESRTAPCAGRDQIHRVG